MFRRILSILTFILITVAFTGCAAGKKRAYAEKKGLMLLEVTQIGRNKSYYSKHKAKSFNRDYKNYKKKKMKHKKRTYNSD